MAAIDPRLAAKAVFDTRYADLVRSGVDAAGMHTWDPHLSRRTRVLVPVDVQAYVAVPGGEQTVPVTGGPDDPDPFAAGAVRPDGVHLHWALPDALLAGRNDPKTRSLVLPPLPDRWVVVRALAPQGARQVRLRGWVIDAATAAVTPLESYTGTPGPAGGRVYEPLDAAAGGSLMWTASYTASADRFAFHDPLADLTPDLHADQAVYTVAGWWSDLAADPLAGAAGPARLDAALAARGWRLVHDDDDTVLTAPDPRLAQVREAAGLTAPVDDPPAKVAAADGAALTGRLDGVAVLGSLPVSMVEQVVVTPALPRYATLLHGCVLGVPVAGPLPAADDRPDPAALGVALGQDLDDVVAAFGAAVLGLDTAHRREAETLVAAFTSGLIEQLGSPDGLTDLAEREHADGFWALPGTPLPGAKPDRLRGEDSAAAGPLTVGRKGRAAQPSSRLGAKLDWQVKSDVLLGGRVDRLRSARAEEVRLVTGAREKADVREVVRPAPRWFRPQAPMLALRGARPSHRHHHDGDFDDGGRLRCRYPSEAVTAIEGVVTGAAVVPSLGSGAVPDEVLTVVREAVLLNPYAYRWLAEAGAPPSGGAGPYRTRLAAEMVRLYGADGRYDGLSGLNLPAASAAAPVSGTWASARDQAVDRQIAQELARHSLYVGTPPSPIAITTWRQPWVPLWLEWQAVVDGSDSVAGWELSDLDLRPGSEPAIPGNPVRLTCTGRSPIGQGAATALREGIRRWIEAEHQREATGGPSALSTADELALQRLGDLLAPMDLVSASLDGIRERLLGIDYVGVVRRGTTGKPQASALPVPLFGGTVQLDKLRLVDAFGRTLAIPAEAVAATATTLDLAVDLPGGMRLRPRLQHSARWLFRLVDPAQPAATAPGDLHEAYVDQLDPSGGVNPVAGFLLPDHIDEELEAFTVGGQALGQLGHDPVTGAVTWEPAPGRPLPPDAEPLADLPASARITGQIAAGLVVADAQARALVPAPAGSALTALLRAVDTTLWTVDTYAAVGSPTVAGLVGRPIAVVRAVLRLDAPDDTAEIEVTEPGGADARRAAFAALAEQRFEVSLGELTRTDDALLGFYVDDDYSRLHLVDRVVAAQARESGRLRGHLGLLGAVTTPGLDPLAHPYLVPDGQITIRPGQTVRLTLLMLPLGRVHLTSGVLPRKHLSLSDHWVTPGLRRLVPSVRVGPVLVDPAEIRLPLVNLLGDKQTFTRRTGPLTWRDDPIVAATQTAYLPRSPHEAQEGWIRVTPEEEDPA
ncbi:hypothetical protein CS0771_47710 [Catellatospora sp. IY07-71]|uniref:hypothetical protein n=1 Tax=Catellatospora sp. IY07-71 TaxID=2728827 RepID=UPI001BB3F6B7|nr:hypothetical protein [Catellatospora sp. IY07-71]BCJ75227.1 hypothetical protein CS0771_47710 [Catellatospora sp. IY07-71]